MRKFSLVFFTALLLSASTSFAQQTGEGLDDFNIPGDEKSLDELVGPEPEVSGIPSANEPVAQDVTTKPVEQTPQKVATAEKLIEVPGVEWVKITLEDKELKGVTFEVPKSWQRKKNRNDWQVKTGQDFDVRLKVDKTPFDKQRFDNEGLSKAPPGAKNFKVESRVINGIEIAVLTGEITNKKKTYFVRAAFFTKPRLKRNKKLALLLNSRNIERDGPIFEHILQSVKLGEELLVDWMEGARKLEFVKTSPGDADGAIKVSNGYYKEMIPGYTGKNFYAVGVDLNNDGMKEWLVYAKEGYICYGDPLKCTTYLFGHMPDGQLADLGYKQFTTVSVLKTSTNGYRDLAFDGDFHSFDGRRYRSGKSKKAKQILLSKAGPVVDAVVKMPPVKAPAPAKYEDYEWVRVGFKAKNLKGITVEVPKHWKSVNDTWGLNYGSADSHEFIQIDWADFPKGGPEGHKPPYEKTVINGRTAYLKNFAETYDGITSYSLNAFLQISSKPVNEPLSITMTTVNRKRGKPIFDHILQSLRIENATNMAKAPLPAVVAEIPNAEWVRITSTKKELKGMSFDVPKNWVRVGESDNWVLEAGSKIEVYLEVSFIRPKGMELAGTKAHLKKFTSRKVVINDIPMEILTAENKHNGVMYNENFVFFGEPVSFSQGKITMMFNTSKIERDGPVFQHILQTVRFYQKPVSAKKPLQDASNSDGPVSPDGYSERHIGTLSFSLPVEWQKDNELSNSISTIFNAGDFSLQIFHSTGFHPLRKMVDVLVPISLAGQKAKRYEYSWKSAKDVVLELDNVNSQGERLSFTFTAPQKSWPTFQPVFDRIVSSIRFGDEAGGKTGAAVAETAGIEFNTDRGGSDYRNFTLKQPDYRICQQACSNEQQCKAWTYVKPGLQGANARCWLKSRVPDKAANDCCTSGLKMPPAPIKAVAPVAPANSENWQTYSNPRFGTSIDYPASIFTAMPPPENGDGRKFESRDGRASFMVFGSHNALDQSIKELYSDQLVSDQYQAILGKYLQENRFTFRARSRQGLVLQMVILDNEGIIHTFQMRYKEADGDALEPVMLRMLKSFSATTKPVAAQQNRQSQNTSTPQDQAVELAFWQSISKSNDPADFEAYLAQWPKGAFAVLAKNNLRRLQKPEAVEAAPAPENKVQSVPRRKYYTPARKTRERKSIMNAARIPVSKALGQRVIFVVSVLRSDGRWAYLQAVPHRPNGGKLNWSRTPYANDWKNDVMSDVVMVLLRKNGGKWKAIDYVIGPTDVHWINWLDQYGLPEALFSAR